MQLAELEHAVSHLADPLDHLMMITLMIMIIMIMIMLMILFFTSSSGPGSGSCPAVDAAAAAGAKKSGPRSDRHFRKLLQSKD